MKVIGGSNVVPPELGLDVVLNSGGPVMTVVDFYGRMLVCAWRDGEDVREHAFPMVCVTVVGQPNPSASGRQP